MFPSNSNNLISSSDQAFHSFERNPNSKEESNSTDLPFSFLDLIPFPFEDNENLLLQFQHQQPLAAEPQPEVSTKKKLPSKGGKQIQRKTCIPSRKDRHSKIHTSRGLRDRRMRLSLQVAKSFFGLQDMLGFDKASKTVEWLLNKAKVEINQLAAATKGASSTSECEGAVSSLEDQVVVNENQEAQVKKRTKRSRKSALHHPLAKECRGRARERARERTKEKMRLKQLGSWINPFEAGEDSGFQIQGVNPSLDLLAEAKEHSSLSKELWGTVETKCYEQRVPIHDFQLSNNSGFLQEVSHI